MYITEDRRHPGAVTDSAEELVAAPGSCAEPRIAAAIAAHADAQGWIIDLRGNGGGGYDQALLERLEDLPRPAVYNVRGRLRALPPAEGASTMTRMRRIVVLAALLGAAHSARAVAPAPGELALAREWTGAHFVRAAAGAAAPREPAAPSLEILANYGPVQRNGRDGQPLRIATRSFEHGIYCHAVSRILVRLPGPARRFHATVGIDTNGNWSGGSAEFKVFAAGKDRCRSPIMRRGEPGAPVSADLDGAAQFILAVGNGGDNVNSDQAAWAEAKVILADGRELRLGDFPILDAGAPAREAGRLPFFFYYDGKPSDELLPSWSFDETIEKAEGGRTRAVQSYRDPATELVVRCVRVEYAGFPTVEWTLFFKNTGRADTPLLESIRPLDVCVARNGERECVLHHFVGSICAANDYEPLEAVLAPGSSKRITTQGGRPTNSDLPYFNLETGGRGGVIAVVGWAGQWAADFVCRQDGAVRISGGQETTSFRLHPGEEVRSPLAVLQFYEGDWHRAQNVWRAWMIRHNLPRPGGKPLRPQAAACNGNLYPGIITNAAEELHFLRRYLEEKIPLDYWWQDAGWYQCGDGGWPRTGTWEVERARWPRGIREVSDFCRGHGIGTIVWFEPERVAAGTYLAENRPEWIYGGRSGGLLRIGDPECRAWLADHIDRLMTAEGIDLYRQDFNIDPLPFWRVEEAEDRQGINEIRHVEGYLAYWDELLRRRPGMLIDSCASGGRRNDLETLRRAVPLLRSDYLFEPVGEQNHTYGISFWMPFNGTGFIEIDPYLIRSQMSPEFTLGCDTRRRDLDYDLLRKLVREWREVSPCYFGDFWPLSEYRKGNDAWMAWQFDRPDSGEGFVQAFRRKDCPEASRRVVLRGLVPDADYQLADADSDRSWSATGRKLMEEGIALEAPRAPAALLITYRRTAASGG